MDDGAIPHPPREALAVDTVVERVRGQWQVSIVVVFADHVVRRVVNTYHSERMANVAASWIKRGADRDPPWLARATGEPTREREPEQPDDRRER